MLTPTFMLTDGCQVIWISCPVKITILLSVIFTSTSHYFFQFNIANKGEGAFATQFYLHNMIVIRGQWGHVGSGRIWVCVCVWVCVCEWKSRPSCKWIRSMCEPDTHRKQEDLRPWPEYVGEGKMETIRLTLKVQNWLGSASAKAGLWSDEGWNSLGARWGGRYPPLSLTLCQSPHFLALNHSFLYLASILLLLLPYLPLIHAPSLSISFYHSQWLTPSCFCYSLSHSLSALAPSPSICFFCLFALLH